MATRDDTFVLTVNPVNDLPTIQRHPDQSTNEDAATTAAQCTIGDVRDCRRGP